MRNISYFLDFKNLNEPVIKWLTAITKISDSRPIFCDTSETPKQTEKKVVLETDSVGDFKPGVHEAPLPLELRNTFNSKSLFPVFHVNEILESDRLLSEIIDTELLLISCPPIDEEKGLQLNALSSRILNKAKCPVVLIPKDVINTSDKIIRIIYNSDIRFTELRLVKVLAKLCKSLKSKLTLAHIADNGIPDLAINYGQSLFEDNYRNYISECEFDMEHIKKLDVQKYPDLIHEYLMGDIYTMINKNKNLKDKEYVMAPAIKFAAIAKKPLLILNA